MSCAFNPIVMPTLTCIESCLSSCSLQLHVCLFFLLFHTCLSCCSCDCLLRLSLAPFCIHMSHAPLLYAFSNNNVTCGFSFISVLYISNSCLLTFLTASSCNFKFYDCVYVCTSSNTNSNTNLSLASTFDLQLVVLLCLPFCPLPLFDPISIHMLSTFVLYLQVLVATHTYVSHFVMRL